MSSKLDQDTEPKFFVSRRGRQVGVHEVDLSGIDIESTDGSGTVAAKQKATKTPMAPRRGRPSTPRAHWTRKKKILVVTVICLVLAIPILFGEFVTAQYSSGASHAKKDIAKLVQTSVLPAQKKTTISADTLRSLANKVNDTVGSMCRGGLLDNAAGLYPRSRAALAECKTAQARYAGLASSLYDLEAEARYLERVDAAIKPVATPITDAYAVIGAQQTQWQSVVETVKKLSPPASLRPAHDELTRAVEDAAAAWSSLNIANNTQNAAEFEAAEQKLVTSYEAVRGIGEKFTQVIEDTQSDILSDYSALRI